MAPGGPEASRVEMLSAWMRGSRTPRRRQASRRSHRGTLGSQLVPRADGPLRGFFMPKAWTPPRTGSRPDAPAFAAFGSACWATRSKRPAWLPLPDRDFGRWLQGTGRSHKALCRGHLRNYVEGDRFGRTLYGHRLCKSDQTRSKQVERQKTEADKLRNIPAMQQGRACSSGSYETNDLIHFLLTSLS